jgi:hypothetical protein
MGNDKLWTERGTGGEVASGPLPPLPEQFAYPWQPRGRVRAGVAPILDRYSKPQYSDGAEYKAMRLAWGDPNSPDVGMIASTGYAGRGFLLSR